MFEDILPILYDKNAHLWLNQSLVIFKNGSMQLKSIQCCRLFLPLVSTDSFFFSHASVYVSVHLCVCVRVCVWPVTLAPLELGISFWTCKTCRYTSRCCIPLKPAWGHLKIDVKLLNVTVILEEFEIFYFCTQIYHSNAFVIFVLCRWWAFARMINALWCFGFADGRSSKERHSSWFLHATFSFRRCAYLRSLVETHAYLGCYIWFWTKYWTCASFIEFLVNQIQELSALNYSIR